MIDIAMRFNEVKATQAAARLLRHGGGAMSYMKLIKLLYLADREALANWGRPITADTYVSMDRGPVLSHVLDLVTEGPSPDEQSFWAQYIGPAGNYEVKLQAEPSDDMLSQVEEELLDAIFKMYGQLSRWDIVNVVHKLPEWQDPHGSAIPIAYAEILRAQHKSPEEIEAIETELAGLASDEAILLSR